MFEKVLLPQTRVLLKKLTRDSLPKGSYLAGGTAVALHLGHRRSADLDFFTPSEFVEPQWEEKLKKELEFKLVKRDWQTLIGTVGDVKISLFYYPHALIDDLDRIYGALMANLPDLAAMKLETVIGRGTKRDLVDIYFLAKKFTLSKLFDFYQEKYKNLEGREIMIKKGLSFFDEADKDEMPDMLTSISWPKIKNWLQEEIKKM